MKKYYWLLIFFMLFLPRIVKADIGVVNIVLVYGVIGIYGLIPIVLIESVLAYFLLNKFVTPKIKFLKILLIIFVANILSFIIGFIASWGLQSVLFLHKLSLGALSISYLATLIIEFIVIYLFIKNKTRNDLIISFLCSVVINIVTYIPIYFLLQI